MSKCYFSGQKYNLSARSQTRMSRSEDNNNSNDHLLYLHYAYDSTYSVQVWNPNASGEYERSNGKY